VSAGECGDGESERAQAPDLARDGVLERGSGMEGEVDTDTTRNRSLRNLPVRAVRSVMRFDLAGGDSSALPSAKVAMTKDVVATEYALTIFVNDQELATVVCTPEYMEDLVIGFLASEGVIRQIGQIRSLTVNTGAGTARVQTATTVNFNQAFYNKRYVGSCCGKSRQSFYFYNDVHTAKTITDDFQLTASEVILSVQRMEDEAALFQETGGVHIACLFGPAGLELARSDIGRHNALDKLYGRCLQRGTDVAGKWIAFSGRVSSEVLLKVAKIGVGVVLAKSAPTALAIDIADELQITTVGFVRGSRFTVYTQPWRIIGTEQAR